MLLAVGCALFLIAVQADGSVAQITPDLLLAAWLWLAGGAFLLIARSQGTVSYLVLGLALSLAYFTKVVALPLAVIAFLMLPFAGADRRRGVRGAVLCLAIFTILIAPYVAKLSAAKGRFTFGESGSLNYAWVVDGSDRWELESDSPHGHARMALVHPARRVLQSPEVYEFAEPVPGSFPMFDDPSYWDDGLKPVFYVKGELWHLAMDSYHTLAWLGRRGEFVIALLLLALVQYRARIPAALREILPVLLWFTCLWGLYMLVDVEDRYVFAVLTSMLLLAAAAIRLPESRQMRRIVSVCALILVCGAALRAIGAASDKFYNGIKDKYINVSPINPKGIGPFDSPYWEVAKNLIDRVGVQPNDSVACMRAGCNDPYWARLAGVRITADVPKEYQYWQASPADRDKAMSALAGVGVKAMVTRWLGPGAETEGWIPLGQSLYARRTK